MRQIVLDTETTGLKASEGHRIIAIGGVELVNRHLTGNNYHELINPERDISEEAVEVHGMTSESLAGYPKFREIAGRFLEYIGEAELVIHNAAFDVGFLNYELGMIDGYAKNEIERRCTILDTLELARTKHPGQRNDLDSLCRRYGVDATGRVKHGALLDAELLATVYLQMTGGQTTLLGEQDGMTFHGGTRLQPRERIENATGLKVVQPSDRDLELHEQWLKLLREQKPGDKPIVWDS
ncbi:MAG: DNA polymerase III subunit epsilon [Gammaproteobacteria bacterium]|nr:DNA polymerase III subunit epsilon [Gammaproteobacteria bacterium]MYD76774.1 DNA polymerase III subunit epsilon [Gammaproteobacteria bacterium]MYJ51888.1 DNA polymerase III subunit epsilon [Gammaproteobacteria bacterium]